MGWVVLDDSDWIVSAAPDPASWAASEDTDEVGGGGGCGGGDVDSGVVGDVDVDVGSGVASGWAVPCCFVLAGHNEKDRVEPARDKPTKAGLGTLVRPVAPHLGLDSVRAVSALAIMGLSRNAGLTRRSALAGMVGSTGEWWLVLVQEWVSA